MLAKNISALDINLNTKKPMEGRLKERDEVLP
jgi:hypothetical protein